jgi:hypothetical protein
MERLGLLAYGSLRWDPRELRDILDLENVVEVETPFKIELARTSTTRRDGCPTLIPVETGGARVRAALIPFSYGVALGDAQTQVWRRELLRTSGTYDGTRQPGPNKVYVEAVDRPYEGFGLVLAVKVGQNIEQPTADVLAGLAIASVQAPAGARREDGISYLIEAKRQGIVTPLMPAYERALLGRLGVASLDEAWIAARSRR